MRDATNTNGNAAANSRGPQKRGLKRRRKLMDTALEIFETRPIEEVSYQDIAAAAEIPLPSCYHFYPGKVDLIRAIADDQTEVFNEMCFAPIDGDSVTSWEDVIDIWLRRAIDFHQQSFARRQIFLGRHMPAEVRIDKQLREKGIAVSLHRMIAAHFEISKATALDRVFFKAIEIATLMVSLDYMEHGQLDDASSNDARLAMLSYLRNFIPPIVPRAAT